MKTKETPLTFSPEVEEGIISIKLPAYLIRRLRAASYALGGLTVEQIAEKLLTMGDAIYVIDFQEVAWEWTDPAEKKRLKKAKAIARKSRGDWDDFCELAASLPPF